MFRFTLASDLPVTPDAVWLVVGTLQGVNRELRPLARMTYPRRYNRLTPDVLPLGRCVFRSWILLGGLIPVDYDDLCFRTLVPGRGFEEESTMLSMQRWSHWRTLEATPAGCRLTDTVQFVPRLAPTGPLFHALYIFAFSLRHRNLRHMFAVPECD